MLFRALPLLLKFMLGLMLVGTCMSDHSGGSSAGTAVQDEEGSSRSFSGSSHRKLIPREAVAIQGTLGSIVKNQYTSSNRQGVVGRQQMMTMVPSHQQQAKIQQIQKQRPGGNPKTIISASGNSQNGHFNSDRFRELRRARLEGLSMEEGKRSPGTGDPKNRSLEEVITHYEMEICDENREEDKEPKGRCHDVIPYCIVQYKDRSPKTRPVRPWGPERPCACYKKYQQGSCSGKETADKPCTCTNEEDVGSIILP